MPAVCYFGLKTSHTKNKQTNFRPHEGSDFLLRCYGSKPESWCDKRECDHVIALGSLLILICTDQIKPKFIQSTCD